MLIWIFYVVLFLMLVVLAYFSPIFFMKPEIRCSVPGIPVKIIKNNSNNVFLVSSNDEYLMIDAGSGIEKMKDALKEFDISSDKITKILLTHTDYDHVGFIGNCKNATVCMARDELQMLNGTVKRKVFECNKIDYDLEKLELLEDGETFNFGDHSFKCIYVPGHTKGSMAYLMDDKWLFTGDSVRIKNGKFYVHPYSMSRKAALNSFEKLLEYKKLGCVFITSHYGVHFWE